MSQSDTLFTEACRYMPGGVNSPVRAFKAVDGTPVFIDHAQGAYLYDVDDQRYIDYVLSWGPLIVGHAHPSVVQALAEQIAKGVSYGAPTQLETALAKKICELMPNIEQLRMVNSGTEATMSALRLARAYTRRDKIVTFTGGYHGHADPFLVQAGSGALTLGTPSSPGVAKHAADDTIKINYNDSGVVDEVFSACGEQIAAVIVEPVAGNMGCIPPLPGFLSNLRAQCDHYGSVLIFDEVMTGFRVGLHGAQGRYDIAPDLTTLGKVMGGGLPAAAFGGKHAIMQQLAPVGSVYQAGTLSGNPLAMAAGLATLELISMEGFYPSLFDRTERLLSGLQQCADHAGVLFSTQQAGSMFGLFFGEQPTSYKQVIATNKGHFTSFFHYLLSAGIYIAPSPYEAGFMSSAHTDEDIGRTLEVAEQAFGQL
jgi:glutamate-1-semialdehyde 2,1-aminomutase